MIESNKAAAAAAATVAVAGQNRVGVECLGRHVLLNAAHKSAIMPTHLISFLLLNKYRSGVSLEQLTNDAQCITTFLQREKSINIAYGHHGRHSSPPTLSTRKSSSSSSSKNASSQAQSIESALSQLGNDLIVVEKSFIKWTLKKNIPNKASAPNSITQNGFSHFKQAYQNRSQNRIVPNTSSSSGGGGGETSDSLSQNGAGNTSLEDGTRGIEMIYIKPILNIRSALELHYYANNCTYSMLFESILGEYFLLFLPPSLTFVFESFQPANSLFSFISVDLSSLICDSSSYISNLTIDKHEFMHKAKRLCHVFQFEFILDKASLSPPTLHFRRLIVFICFR